MPLSVEQYEDFVLKLKIKADDGTSQIRRVRLPRISDAAGNVSYEELVGLVVTFTFSAESSPGNFDCTLTYFDEDEDTVTIASTSELVDAVEQFVDKKVLRISTEVKRKTSATHSTPQITQTPQSTCGTTDRGTSTKPENLEANLQNVLESFASVIVTAVSSLEKGLAANSANTSAQSGSNVAAADVSTTSSESTPKAPEEAITKPAAKPAPLPAEKPTTKPAPTPVEERAAKPTHMPAEKPASKPVVSAQPAAQVKDTVVPYVHLRHTCDSCLMNPIVGTRYHAGNMIDYDLCEICFPNYSGKETEFVMHPSLKTVFRNSSSVSSEPVNHDALLASQGFSGASSPSSNPAPQEAASPEAAPEPAASTESVPSPAADNHPFIHGRHTCDSCLMNPIIGKRYHASNLKDYDLCENCHPNYQGTEIQFEAVELSRDRAFQKRWIRRRERIEKMNGRRPKRRLNRSSAEAAAAEEPPRPEPTSEPSPEDTAVHPPSAPPSAPVQESTARVIPIQSSEPTSNPAEDFDGALKEAIRRSLEDVMPKEVQEFFEPTEPVVTPSAPTEEEILTVCGTTEIVNPPVTPTRVPEAEVVEDVAITELESRASSSLEEVDEQQLLDSMVEDTMSVDSEEMMAANDIDMKPSAVDRETSMPTPERKTTNSEEPKTPGSTTDDSFALDAVGNGDVAEAMGAALDMVAGVISEMLTEADANSSPTAILDEVIASSAEQPDLEVVEAEVDATEEAGAGTLIMGSEEVTEDPKEEVDGWEVVDSNPKESNDIANATQMLGSALFNSDIRSSGVLESTNSGDLSAASSVPSDLTSLSAGTDASRVSELQRNRWASQLFMMREMGFDDEEKCVETLERLQAANIGCGEEDEVSVTQAVEAMLSELK